MISVYVDFEAVYGGPAEGAGIAGAAARSLGFLTDAGHQVVVAAPAAGEVVDAVPKEWPLIDVIDVPVSPSSRAWYVTTDVDRCRGRSALLRTILIGQAPPRAIHRCDSSARDLQSAVLEILAAEAMQ